MLKLNAEELSTPNWLSAIVFVKTKLLSCPPVKLKPPMVSAVAYAAGFCVVATSNTATVPIPVGVVPEDQLFPLPHRVRFALLLFPSIQFTFVCPCAEEIIKAEASDTNQVRPALPRLERWTDVAEL